MICTLLVYSKPVKRFGSASAPLFSATVPTFWKVPFLMRTLRKQSVCVFVSQSIAPAFSHRELSEIGSGPMTTNPSITTSSTFVSAIAKPPLVGFVQSIVRLWMRPYWQGRRSEPSVSANDALSEPEPALMSTTS